MKFRAALESLSKPSIAQAREKKASAGVLQEGIATRGLLTRAFTAPL